VFTLILIKKRINPLQTVNKQFTIHLRSLDRATKSERKMKVKEIYKQESRYNARIKATVGSAWMAVLANGDEFPKNCADYQAANKSQASALNYLRNIKINNRGLGPILGENI
jgi:hypothetical protein